MLDFHSARLTQLGSYEVRDDARRFEFWEGNFAARLGLGAAVDYALELGLNAIEARVKSLAAQLRDKLSEVAEIHDAGVERCGIVTFTKKGHEAEDIRRRFFAEKMNVSVVSPSGAPLAAALQGVGPMVRASAHYFNTEDEINRLVRAVGLL